MPEICPFLAATHDLDSVLGYPSEGNVCTRLGEAQPVATGHQASYCLRARYWFCPVYNGAIKQPPVPIAFEDLPPAPLATPPRPMPVPLILTPPAVPDSLAAVEIKSDNSPAIAASRSARVPRTSRATLIHPREAATLILILAVVGVGGSLLSNQLHSQLAATDDPTRTMLPSVIATGTVAASAPSAGIMLTASPTITASLEGSATPTPTDRPTASITSTLTLALTATGISTPSITPSPRPTATTPPTLTVTATNTAITPIACAAPTDWINYTIQPGETYYHIAEKFGTTVDSLQRVNCLADPQRVLSGQVIHVPPTPGTAVVTP